MAKNPPLSAGKGVLVPLFLDHEQRSSQSARGMIAVKRPNEEHGKETATSNLVIQRHADCRIERDIREGSRQSDTTPCQ